MANEIRIKKLTIAELSFGTGLNGLTAGSAVASAAFPTNVNLGAIIQITLKSGATAPAAGNYYEVYKLYYNGTNGTDAWAGVTAGITIECAKLIDLIPVTATADKFYRLDLDTSVFGFMGTTCGIAIKNGTNQALATTGNIVTYEYYLPEIQ